MTTLSKNVIIQNKLGLHARAATKLAKLSMQYQADVTVTVGEKSADAGAIMGLMLLSGAQGKTANITASGDDAKPALTAICQLIEDKFDEDE